MFVLGLAHSAMSASLSALSGWKLDRAKKLASQIAGKSYFAGEAAGLRLASREGLPRLPLLLNTGLTPCIQDQTDWISFLHTLLLLRKYTH